MLSSNRYVIAVFTLAIFTVSSTRALNIFSVGSAYAVPDCSHPTDNDLTLYNKEKQFLEQDGDVNRKDKNGNTELLNAVESDASCTTALLLNHGADPNIKDVGGSTALLVIADRGTVAGIMNFEPVQPGEIIMLMLVLSLSFLQ